MKKGHVDTILVTILVVLLAAGALMFSSAAIGLVARGSTHISSVAFNHFFLGIGGGLVAFTFGLLFDYRKLRALAPYIFGASLIATSLVFVPGLGLEHGGGRRWLDLGFFTGQPSELLKLGAIIMAASIFAVLRADAASWKGIAYFVGIIAGPTILLALQPDFGTLGIVVMCVLAIAVAAGVRWSYILLFGLTAVLVVLALSFTPKYSYLYDRIITFVDPGSQNALGEGYQIRQSLIAVGSGGFTGRGLGQGIQKFTYLPEPMGDSIYAVVAEETGFIGASVTILLFLFLGLRGFIVAARSPDLFGSLMAVGISAYLAGEAFINIAAMLGLAPLTGIPLTFMSQGASAMIVSLLSAGILVNISRAK